MTATAPICPYCDRASVLVTGRELYPHRLDLAFLKFWSCAPCDAYVGCHKAGAWVPDVLATSDGTIPLGRLANAELRRAKGQAHAAFDPLWRSRQMKRKQAYAWLARELGISAANAHIGMFDVEQCRAVVAAVEQYRMGVA